MRESLLELSEAVGWSDRLEASLIAGIEVIQRTLDATHCPIFMIMDDPEVLVRVAGPETSAALGPYFETMPALEHAHPPWLNRELSPVCAADHLADPAWELLDERFRDWFGSNGVVAPIVGDRHHLGAVLVTFEDPERRLEAHEVDFLTLAGRSLGAAIVRMRMVDDIRRDAIAEERRRAIADFELSIGSQLAELAEDLDRLTAQPLNSANKDLVVGAHRKLARTRELVAQQTAESQSAGRSAAVPFTRQVAQQVAIFEQKWAIPAQLEMVGSHPLDALPITMQSQLLELVQSALADIRERAGAKRAFVQIEADQDTVRLRVTDDGKVSDQSGDRSAQRVLRERVEDLGGRVRLRALPRVGSRLEVTIPTTIDPRSFASSSVLLADPDALFREGVAALLRQWDEFRVVARVSDSREALNQTNQLAPDLLLIDIAMPGAVAVIRALHRGPSKTRVVVLTESQSEADIRAAIQAGARGYLLKDKNPYQLRDDINAVVAGHTAMPAEIASRARAAHASASEARLRAAGALTKRESEVLALVTEGLANEEIAERLHLSISTVKKHLGQVMTKLQLTNRVQLAVYAVRSGIVS